MLTRDRTDHSLMPASHYEQLVQAVVDYAIYMLDPSGHVVSWNAGAERIKGYRAEEVVGRHFSQFFTPQDCADNLPERLLRQALEQGVAQDEGWRVRKDGSQFWALAALDVVRNPEGEIIGLAKVTRDITDRRDAALELDEVRAQLFQAQKLEALGQLTGGLAHDFNNLLTIIISSARLARASQDPQRLQRLLDNIVDTGQRGAQLTEQLLSFARHRQLSSTAIAPGDLISATLGLAEHAIPRGITLQTDVPADLPTLEVDPGQLQMVLLNLLFNARDAIVNDEGLISLDAHAVRLGGEVQALHGAFLRFDVQDSGVGIEPQAVPRIFEPFFSTKPFGKGTGLGLSQVYGFARQSGGAICVTRTGPDGTCMSLYLPVRPAAQTP